MSSFSNFGDCVDIFAPGASHAHMHGQMDAHTHVCMHAGSAITSTWIGGPSATNTISGTAPALMLAYAHARTRMLAGTSMASPHVAGVVAKLLASYPKDTPKQMIARVKKAATAGAIKGLDSASPNELVYASCA